MCDHCLGKCLENLEFKLSTEFNLTLLLTYEALNDINQ